MGGSSWSDDFYKAKNYYKTSRGIDTFTYDTDIKAGKVAAKVHDKLSPRGVTRESRDSDVHPASVAIGVIFDVTGSMGGVPEVMQTKLPQLMGLLLRKGYIQDPQVLFGAVGDFHSDRVPLQIGQFESGVEMDDDVTNIYLEGGGGGSREESYQNAMYFFARHTSIDCWEKRQKKGYLFLIGDERPYPRSSRDEISTIFGDTVQADVTTDEIVRELKERYEVFFIIPTEGTSHGRESWLKESWSKLLGGQNVIMLSSNDAVCESIATAIGLVEGTADAATIVSDLKDVGASDAIVRAVSNGLGDLAKSTALANVGTGSLPSGAPSGKVARL